jgi:hypothetical protein
MTTTTVHITSSVAATSSLERFEPIPAASNASPGLHRTVPTFIGVDEAYYWSVPWQEDVRESMAALNRGDFEEFHSDDPTDVVRWLLSDDD